MTTAIIQKALTKLRSLGHDGIEAVPTDEPQRLILPAGGVELNDLAAFIGEAFGGESDLVLTLLPDSLPSPTRIMLTEFFFEEEVGIIFGLAWDAEPWPLFRNLIELQGISARLLLADVANTSSANRVSATFTGNFDFVGVSIELEATMPDLTIVATFVPSEGTWKVGDFLDDKAFTGLNVAGLEDFSLRDIAVTHLSLLGDVEAQSVTFDLELDSKVTVAGNSSLEKVNLSLVYLGGQPTELVGFVSGDALFGQQSVRVGAEYGGAGNGWLFSGQAILVDEGDSLGNGVAIGAWLGSFKAFIESPPVPRTLKSFLVTRFEIEFGLGGGDTGGFRDLIITAEGSFTLNDEKRIEALVTINVVADEVFVGRLFLEGLDFSFKLVDIGEDEQLMLATYDAADAWFFGAIDFVQLVDDLVPGVTIDLGGTELDIVPNRALVVFSQGGDSDWAIFLADMGNVDDLSAIPLVGEYFDEYELSFGYRLAVASRNLTTEDARTINEQLPEGFGHLPVGAKDTDIAIGKNLTLLAQIDLGASPLQLLSGGDTPAGSTPAEPEPDGPAAPASLENSINWLAVQKGFGPLYLSRVGFRYEDGTIAFLLDASLIVGPLTFSLRGLQISSPLAAFEPQLDLAGLGLSLRSGPVEVAGILLRDGDAFAGVATIRAKTFAVSAFGAYRQLPAGPSMFLYAFLDKPIGGPSFFFVTGLAIGLGYNRDITIPAIEGVEVFPLVQAARGKDDLADTEAMLTALTESSPQLAPPKIGAYWIAAGVRFDSFKLIDSFALLLVRFGRELEISLLGMSTLVLPKQKDSALPPKVYAEIAFKVSFKPNDGLVAVEGLLTENSYVIEPAARLRGGFAFYVWYSGQYNGDFILTLGGYHPRFIPPAHYPRVPRLVLNWPMPEHNLHIRGEAYFALTPSSVMAGGKLVATYEKGDLSATFTAYADFIIGWKPFFYDIEIGIRLLVRYYLGELLGTAAAELSADLRIWGPEFSGIANVSWTIFSFTIRFGDQNDLSRSTILEWDDFAESFLPQPKDGKQQVARILIAGGLEKEIVDGTSTVWLVRPDALSLATESAIPITKIEAGSNESHGADVGVRPMDSGAVESTHTVAITYRKKQGDRGTSVELDQWQPPATRRSGVPEELWNPAEGTHDIDSPTPSARILPDRLIGIDSLRPALPEGLGESTQEMDLETFEFDPIEPTRDLLLASPVLAAAPGVAEGGAFDKIGNTAVETTEHRQLVLAAVRQAGYPLADVSGELSVLGAEATTAYREAPLLGALGAPLMRAVTTIDLAEAPPLVEVEEDALRAIIIRLLAIVWQFPSNGTFSSVGEEYRLEQEPGSADIFEVHGPLPTPVAGVSRPTFPAFNSFGSTELPPAVELVAGKTLLWQIQREKNASEVPLQLDAALRSEVDEENVPRLRIVALDKYSRLLTDEVHQASNPIPLDAATSYLAVTCLRAAPPEEPAVGWNGNSNLLQVRPRAILGEKAVVRPQATRRIKHRGRGYSFGLVSGNRLAQENLVYVNEDETRHGWIRTLLSAEVAPGRRVRTVAVLVSRSPDDVDERPPRPDVWSLNRDGEKRDMAPTGLPFPESDARTGWVYVYRLPANLLVDDSGMLAFTVATEAPWVLTGVMGFGRARIGRRDWPGLSLESELFPAEGEQVAPVDVRLETLEAGG